jgi:DNA-binding NtrC family response regulator
MEVASMRSETALQKTNQKWEARICVIEEDEAVRDAICALLHAYGYAPVGLARAKDPLCTGPIDCLVVAVDGRPAAEARVRTLLAANPELPVILMRRGLQWPSHGRLDARLVGVLEKPFPPDRLLQMLAQALPSGTAGGAAG